MKPVLLLDWGGVVFTEGHSAANERLEKEGFDRKKIVQFLREDPKAGDYKRGKISLKEYKEYGKTLFGDKIDYIINVGFSSYTPMPGMLELLPLLSEKFELIAFSGNTRERVEHLENKYHVLKHFASKYFSFDIGHNKPDDSDEFYTKAVDILKLKNRDVIYVDDQQKYLDRTKKLGWRTILFENADQLRKDLNL